MYLGGVASLVDAEGNILKEETKKFLVSFLEKFAAWTELFARGGASTR
jgi:hypothetical protein